MGGEVKVYFTTSGERKEIDILSASPAQLQGFRNDMRDLHLLALCVQMFGNDNKQEKTDG